MMALSGSMATIQVEKARSEAETVRQTLVSARDLARFSLKCVLVEVFPQSLRITPYDVCTPTPSGAGSVQTINFDPVISLASFDTGSSLLFNPQGGTMQGTPATLTVNSAAGRVFNYTVLPAIGSISMR